MEDLLDAARDAIDEAYAPYSEYHGRRGARNE